MNFKQSIVIFFRILVPLSILINPLIGLALSGLADAVDVIIWDNLKVKPPLSYHRLDKLLDNCILFIAAAVSIYYIPVPYLYFAYFLYFLRLVISTLFIVTGKDKFRKLFLIGPNLFPWYFALFAMMDLVKDYGVLQNNLLFTVIVIFVFIGGYLPEIILHYKKIKLHALLKKFFNKYQVKNEG